MIHYKVIDFDIDSLKREINSLFKNTNLISLTQLENYKCFFDTIIIEYPYKDVEFSSVYSIYYSKKFRKIQRDTLRIHFFNESENIYGGYLIITDSPMESIGRGVFDLEVIAPKGFYVLNMVQKIHFMGDEYQVCTFPWMMQDTDVDVCAHVALWSLNTYFAHKLPYYRYFTIGEIALNTPNYLGRTIPSEGLNVLQMSDVLLKMNFYPIVLFKDELKEQFFDFLYSYLESGFPVLVGMNEKEHAITIMGHGPIDYNIPNNEDIISTSKMVKSYLAVDDNYLPFTIVGKNGKYSLDDIDYFIVPLPEKIFLNVGNVYKETEIILKKVIKVKGKIVVRIYLTTIKNFKEYISRCSVDENTKEVLLKLESSRFVWIADVYNTSKRLISKIVFDATAGEYEKEKWIAIIDENLIIMRDSMNVIREFKIERFELKEFNNNLREIV